MWPVQTSVGIEGLMRVANFGIRPKARFFAYSAKDKNILETICRNTIIMNILSTIINYYNK